MGLNACHASEQAFANAAAYGSTVMVERFVPGKDSAPDLLRRLLEQSAAWVQQAVVDPEGDFVTLAERVQELGPQRAPAFADASHCTGVRALSRDFVASERTIRLMCTGVVPTSSASWLNKPTGASCWRRRWSSSAMRS